MTEQTARNRFVIGARPVDEGTETMAIPLAGKHEALVERADGRPQTIAPRQASLGALALADFERPAVSAGERLIRLAYRLGVSGHTLTAPFRKPVKPRLLATVASPLQGDRVAGTALRAGHFLVHGVKVPIGQVDFTPAAKLSPPFERTVHGFTWLRDSTPPSSPTSSPSARARPASPNRRRGLPSGSSRPAATIAHQAASASALSSALPWLRSSQQAVSSIAASTRARSALSLPDRNSGARTSQPSRR